MIPKKVHPGNPSEFPLPEKHPEIIQPFDPEDPVMPPENPDIIPDEDPFETPPYEIPPPGETP